MKYFAVVVVLGLSLVGYAAQAQSQANADKEAVRQAAQDYIDALYQAKPELIARSFHPSLRKVGFMKKQGQTTFSELPMTYDQLYNLAGSWNKDGKRPVATAPNKVDIHEVLNQTASAKITALWGVDYLHLAKYDGKWKIVNVLWQEPPGK